MADPEIERLWSEVHAATPPGWFVGRPGWDGKHHQWTQYAYDPHERVKSGRGSLERERSWTAVGTSEAHALEQMAYCLREIAAGRVPQ